MKNNNCSKRYYDPDRPVEKSMKEYADWLRDFAEQRIREDLDGNWNERDDYLKELLDNCDCDRNDLEMLYRMTKEQKNVHQSLWLQATHQIVTHKWLEYAHLCGESMDYLYWAQDEISDRLFKIEKLLKSYERIILSGWKSARYLPE